MLKVGDRVKIAKTSNYYDKNGSKDGGNPPNVEGYIHIIVEQDYLPFKVKWDTGRENSYREVDLDFMGSMGSKVEEPEVIYITDSLYE